MFLRLQVVFKRDLLSEADVATHATRAKAALVDGLSVTGERAPGFEGLRALVASVSQRLGVEPGVYLRFFVRIVDLDRTTDGL